MSSLSSKLTLLRTFFTQCAFGALVGFFGSCALAAEHPAASTDVEDGFVSLFDGKTLQNWSNPYSWGKAEVVNGEIHLTGDKKFFLVTEKRFANFIFESEVLLPDGKANSGFMFRAQVSPGKVLGYQAEVDGDVARNWSGGLYDEARRMWFISPIKADSASVEAFKKRAGDCFKRNEWNRYRITCQGAHLKIEVNGVVTTDIEDNKDASGVFGLQHHGERGQTYRFRNLRVKMIP